MAETWYKEIWRIIRAGRTSTSRTQDGQRTFPNSSAFKGLSLDRQAAINSIIEEHQEGLVRQQFGGGFKTLNDVRQEGRKLFTMLTMNYRTRTEGGIPLKERVLDSYGIRDVGYNGAGGFGGVGNQNTRVGIPGQDPAIGNNVWPNMWIGPQEAANIFSQKGLPEAIIRKKSQSILLNGVNFKNPFLSPKQLDDVKKYQTKLSFDHRIAEVTRDSLGFGGSVIFPMFKKDSPVTMGMSIDALARAGVVGKDCIDRFVTLDRWNTINIPSWNPTAKDFYDPDFYFIPFLGSEVSGKRISRIRTAPQMGYWGNLMTLGWGISDFPGWIQAVWNYMNVMEAIPTMINQMSILARTINIDGSMATEGEMLMEDLANENTIRMRQVSAQNPITMDVIGDIKSIQRDFKEVPELVRLIRQDAAARANVQEELLWSSEKGAFSSGDTTDGAFDKQYETTRYLHLDVAEQLRAVAKLVVISALGLDREVLKALPYTTVDMDSPKVTNASDRAEITGKVSKAIFDMVAAGMKLNTATSIAQTLAGEQFTLEIDTLNELEAAQKEKDQRDAEKHELDMALQEAQIQQAENPVQPAAGGAKPKKPAKKQEKKKDISDGPATKGEHEGHSYKDRLEQRSHERIGAGQREGLQRAQTKLQ